MSFQTVCPPDGEELGTHKSSKTFSVLQLPQIDGHFFTNATNPDDQILPLQMDSLNAILSGKNSAPQDNIYIDG